VIAVFICLLSPYLLATAPQLRRGRNRSVCGRGDPILGLEHLVAGGV